MIYIIIVFYFIFCIYIIIVSSIYDFIHFYKNLMFYYFLLTIDFKSYIICLNNKSIKLNLYIEIKMFSEVHIFDYLLINDWEIKNYDVVDSVRTYLDDYFLSFIFS